MSVTCLHLNSTLFPEPDKFVPDRWLEPRSRGLEQYLVPFSKGPRMCLGIQYVRHCTGRGEDLFQSYSIAWAELYLIFGHIFRRMEMEIVETRCVVDFLTANISHFEPDFASSLDDFCRFKDYFVPIHQGRQLHVRSKQTR